MRDDFDILKRLTIDAFLEPTEQWIDGVKDVGDPRGAIAGLAIFLGHMLAGAATELGVADQIDPIETGALIARTIQSQIEELKGQMNGHE